MHHFFEVLTKRDKTPDDKALIAGVMFCSTQPGFSHLTPEEVYEKLVTEWEEVTKATV